MSILFIGNSSQMRTCGGDCNHTKQIGNADLPITLIDEHPDMRGQVAAKGAILRQPHDDAAQDAHSLHCKTSLHQEIAQLRDFFHVTVGYIFDLQRLQHL